MREEEHPDALSPIDGCVARLKTKIPPMEHGALDSRVEALLNDASATPEEVIAILLDEFDPQG